MPIALIVLLVQVLMAQQIVTAADLEVTKSVNRTEARHGDTVQYSINMSNIGADQVDSAVMTDTVPSELTVISSSVSVLGGSGSWGVDGNVITWTGAISGSGEAIVTFDAVVTDTAAYEPVTNTVYVTGTGSLLSQEAVFTVTERMTYTMYFPVIYKALPAPILISVSTPTSSDEYITYKMTATWSDVGLSGGYYEIQESRTPDFANPTTYNTGTDLTKLFNFGISRNYEHYFRVRFVLNGFASGWSNVIKQYGPYIDHFNDANRDWKIRREDLDDTNNSSYYQDGNYVLKIGGRWHFAVGGPMKIVPWPSYSIEARVRFDDGVDNLHSYGFIWGGDWNGTSACPNVGFTTCLNHYYRLNVLWNGTKDQLQTQIKRIDYHDDDGVGRGASLAGYAENGVNSPSGGWQIWKIKQYQDGKIEMYINGILKRTVYDDTYAGAGTYFGVMATSNEYSGAEPWFDWVKVLTLP